MNILVLHDEKESELIHEVMSLLGKKLIPSHARLMEIDWYKKCSFFEILSDYSHFILMNTDSFESNWESLCIGYALGLQNPLIIFGRLPSYLDNMSSVEYKFCKTEKEFSDFLDGDFSEWVQRDIQKQARNDLLAKGIPHNEESLERCIFEENTWAVELFLKAGFLPNAADKNGVPLLNLAARSGNRNTVRVLLEGGAAINQQSQDRGSSALIDACTGKAVEIVKDLIAVGADVNLKSKDGQSALVIAVGLNDKETVEELLKAGANPDDPDALGASARKYASLFNKPGMMALFDKYAPV